MVAEAETDLAETPEQVIKALETHLKITKEFELTAQERVNSGLRPFSEKSLIRCWRLAAELDLLRAKRYFQTYRPK
jgi:hypothetical protein